MSEYIIYMVVTVVFFYLITRPPRCPRCGKRMDENYNPDNGVSYNECPHCGYIDITGYDNYDTIS